jgi:hypothetical protein
LIEDNPKIVWLVIGAVIVAGALSAGVIGYFVAQIPQPPNSGRYEKDPPNWRASFPNSAAYLCPYH